MKDFSIHKKKNKMYKKDIFVKQSAKQNKKQSTDLKHILLQKISQGLVYLSKLTKDFSLPHLQLKHYSLTKLRLVKSHKGLHRFLKKRESDLQLVLFPLILLFVLFSLTVINDQIYRSNVAQELPPDTIRTQLNPYPFVQAIQTPELSAEAALILDRNSQVILYSKNPLLRFSMASTTKIMTALTALDYYSMQDILTVQSIGVEGSGLGLVAGDQFYFEDLLYMMLLPSANDAAQTVADNYPGGADAFVQKMNEKTQSLQLHDTHFSDPTGLDDDGDYTTAVDLARLASHAISNPKFVEVTSTKFRTVRSINYGGQYELNNLNVLLGSEGVTGIKTGTTEGAGQVLVTSTIKNGHTYIIVVMHSEDRFSDTGLLLQFIDERVEYVMPSIPQLK